MNQTITSVPGIEAGHYTDLQNATGCTVVLCRKGAVGGVDVRGGSPGTRETDLLRPSRRVDQLFAVTLSGGSAFGLDAASGVMAWLEEQDIGYRVTPDVIVPIVSSAIIYDLGLVTSKVRPGPTEGRAVKGGLGTAALRLPGGASVGAVVVVNSIGGVRDPHAGQLVAGPRREDGSFDDPVGILLQDANAALPAGPVNTTIGVVATDARLTREETNYLARVSHNGLSMTIHPCHTIRDGDTMFAMATGEFADNVDLTTLGAAVAEVAGQAVLRAVRLATGLGGIPAASELPGV